MKLFLFFIALAVAQREDFSYIEIEEPSESDYQKMLMDQVNPRGGDFEHADLQMHRARDNIELQMCRDFKIFFRQNLTKLVLSIFLVAKIFVCQILRLK